MADLAYMLWPEFVAALKFIFIMVEQPPTSPSLVDEGFTPFPEEVATTAADSLYEVAVASNLLATMGKSFGDLGVGFDRFFSFGQ